MEISGFDEFDECSVRRILVSDRCSQHSRCVIDLTMENHKAEYFIFSNKVGEKTLCVSIEGDLVFSGTVRSIRLKRAYSKTDIQAEAVSFTDLMDSEIHNRVFQNPNKTYGQINEFFTKDNIQIACIAEEIHDEKIEGILIQHKETDFEFLKRIYQEKGCFLFLDNHKKSGCIIEIGEKKKTGIEWLKSKDIIRFEQTIYENKKRAVITTKRIFDAGSEIYVFGTAYVICARTIDGRGDTLEIEYELEEPGCSEYSNTQDHLIRFGQAKVTCSASEDHLGKIQVEFLGYDNVMTDEKIWLDYLSPLTEKEGGIAAVPDEGEIVEVLMGQSECIAVGCVRRTELDERIQDLSKRSMLVRGCLVRISENKAEIEAGSGRVCISDKILHISNEKFEILIKENQCKIGFDESQIVLEDDCIQLDGKKKLEMKTNLFEIEGTKAVKVKTKSFDVG